MRILAIGDVFGRPGLKALRRFLPDTIDALAPGVTIVNVENLHDGRGVDPAGARDVFDLGADALTTGNHVWGRREHEEVLDGDERILRPINYPPPCPGRGISIVTSRDGIRVAVINVIGRIFMQPVDCPFRTLDAALEETAGKADVVAVDVHAEATSEKAAVAHHLDGRVAAVFGTHTHVQTADARVLPSGTGFITDLGMTGPYASIIGKEPGGVLQRFLTGRPSHAATATGEIGMRGALFEVDEASGRCTSVARVAEGEGGR